MLSKPIIFSAVQPSGNLTLGNYIGSLSHWSIIQNNATCIYSIADLHALTSFQEHRLLRKITFDTLAFYLASGVDPKKSIIFIQSSVSEHCQLNWILNCYTYFGELIRMTQFKHKSKINSKNVNVGLLNYPILMSSDILLYQTDYIIVGHDQKQHLELAKKIANRFNVLHGKTFKLPSNYKLNDCHVKIMALLNPTKKMSKSDVNINNVIFLLDDKQSILRKISRSITDSENKIFYEPNRKAGISNLLNILASLTGKKISVLEKEFYNVSYNTFKKFVSDTIYYSLNILQEKFLYFRNNELYLQDILDNGSHQASLRAKITLEKVYYKMGLS
ncbi:Tryptophan--tRNA ligase [Buchnera aphidicola (Symydobius americanus)]